MIQSPLNYTGGKFKLLPQILPLFPKNIGRFFDFFCEGCNVGINVDCKENIFIDKDENLIYLYQAFKNLEKKSVFEWIYEIIDRYGLSLVSRNGYAYYGCESTAGLGNFNREPFKKLRDDFNKCTVFDYKYYVMLYVIIVYAFNNQIRFNSDGNFNLPVGKRDFNSRMHEKLNLFIDKLQTRNYKFVCSDFRDFTPENFLETDFVYADPPYLITCATYNENGGWNESDEKDLLNFFDELNAKKIRFALSNVLTGKGSKNQILIDWLENNTDKYQAVHLKHSYSNSNYHKIDKISVGDEVLIVNYKIDKGQVTPIELAL